VEEQKGRIDVLFANAGVAGESTPLGKITEALFDALFDVNVRGLLFSVKKALPLFRDGGSIVLNASTASIMAIPAGASTPPTRPPCARSPALGRPN
jgi:NAD(P)-dependent dehydrogenase (short-subunit alcohol dehydrogenase family)